MGYGVPDSGVDFVYITVEEAYALMKNDKAVFVDSRDRENYDATRVQTSFHMAANDLIFAKTKIDSSLVQHLIDLAANGKTIVTLSDACIRGDKNRGHVSRCRHVAQYLVELGADRTRVVRMTGGINAWKAARLDGILGGLRPMFAGAWQEEGFHAKIEEDGEQGEAPAASAAIQGPAKFQGVEGEASSAVPALAPGVMVEIKGLKSRADLNGKRAKVLEWAAEAGRWEVEVSEKDCTAERLRCKPENLMALPEPGAAMQPAAVAREDLPKKMVCCGGDVSGDGVEAKMMCEVIDVPRRPFVENTPTAYRVLKGEIYRKPSRDSEKIVKIERPVSATVRTTGEVYEGANGGRWAELDVTAGEKKGWAYIEGPGFGPSSRKIRTEFLRP